MKKLMIGAAIAAAAMFAACDDSSSGDSSLGSCDVNVKIGEVGSVHVCAEASDVTKIKSVCKDVQTGLDSLSKLDDAMDEEDGEAPLIDLSALMSISGTAKDGSGCSGKPTKTCTEERDGMTLTINYYDKSAADKDCKELGATMKQYGF